MAATLAHAPGTRNAIAALAVAAIAACGGGEKKPSAPKPEPVSIADLEVQGVRALDALEAVARNPEHDQRLEAIRALGRLGDDRAVAALAEIAGADAASVRAGAARALGVSALMGASSEPVVAALVARLDTEGDPEVEAELALALGRSQDQSALEPLVVGLAAENTEVVDAAALGLGLLGRGGVALDDAARRQLAELASDAPHRYAATYALAREHRPPVNPVVLRVLEAVAGDPDPEVRAMALAGLSRRRRGRARFVAALDDDDWRVAVAAIDGLSALKSDAATGDLARWLAARDPLANPMLTRAALRVMLERADVSAARSAVRVVLEKTRTGGATLDRAQIRCLAEAVKARYRRDLTGLRSCADAAQPWWHKSLVAEVVAKRRAGAETRLTELASLHADDDPRVKAAALTGMTRLAANLEVRRQVIDAVTRGLADRSAAVAGTAAEAIAGLSLKDSESGATHAALVERAADEIKSDGELGLSMVSAIAANRVAAGEPVCRQARGHANRALRRAGRECLEVLTGTDPGPGAPAAAAIPPHRPRASAPLRWSVETSRGALVIELDPSRAPWHVAAIAGLTRDGFYDGLLFHRVVPGFVTQGGDPTGTGWGGPGFSLPPEPSDAPYVKGTVGVADAGPGTGGSQWFVTHGRTPRLEGRYTVIGEIVSGAEVIDALSVGDRIVTATIGGR